MAAPRTPRSGTPALTLMRQLGIRHSIHEYEHDKSAKDFGAEAVRALGLDAGAVLKTLIWETDGQPCTVVIPVAAMVSAKKLAAVLGAKRASIATTATAERLSGSVIGAISPLGLRREIPTVVDISSLGQPQVYVSAGRRGLELGLAPEDLIATTKAIVAEVTEDALAT